jgi:hypothetical protein
MGSPAPCPKRGRAEQFRSRPVVTIRRQKFVCHERQVINRYDWGEEEERSSEVEHRECRCGAQTPGTLRDGLRQRGTRFARTFCERCGGSLCPVPNVAMRKLSEVAPWSRFGGRDSYAMSDK